MKKNILYTILISLLLISYSQPKIKAEKTGILNTHWKLVKLNNEDIKISKNQEKEQYFILKDNNKLSGYSGCNYFFGRYNLNQENQKLSFDKNIGLTRMMCQNNQIKEYDFMEVFKLGDNYTLHNNTLTLNTKYHIPLAVFVKIE